MDREEAERIRRAPGTTVVGGGVSSHAEVSHTVWHVDNETGEVTPLGKTSYWHPNPLNRALYRFLRKRGLV